MENKRRRGDGENRFIKVLIDTFDTLIEVFLSSDSVTQLMHKSCEFPGAWITTIILKIKKNFRCLGEMTNDCFTVQYTSNFRFSISLIDSLSFHLYLKLKKRLRSWKLQYMVLPMRSLIICLTSSFKSFVWLSISVYDSCLISIYLHVSVKTRKKWFV